MSERLGATTESWRPQRRGQMFDPQMRRLALMAAGAVAMVALGVGSYATIAHRTHGVPVIEADSRPLRVKPDNPGGMQVAGAEEQIMGGSAGSQADMMAPAPELPQPQALRAQIQAGRQAAPPPAQPSPQPIPAQPVSLAATPPTVPPPVSAAPEQRPAVAPPARPAAARPAPATVAASGKMEVQLAAMESEQAAMGEWHRLAKRMPDLLGSRQPSVMKAERDGKVFYRLRTGGFADTAQATAFCTQVKSKGGGCAIASF